ncbi:MAG: hypothetical protein ACOZAN_02400 [Patescibacteria group bacterium]
MSNQFSKQLAGFRQQRHLLIGMVFMFVIVVLWTGVSLFSSQQRVSISAELQKLAQPLTPTVKEEIITNIEKKRSFSDTELGNFTIYKYVTNKENTKAKLVEIGTDDEQVFATPTPKPKSASNPLSDVLKDDEARTNTPTDNQTSNFGQTTTTGQESALADDDGSTTGGVQLVPAPTESASQN